MRNTERVLSNGAVDRIIEIERQKGADLKIEDIRHLVGSVYPKVMTDGDLEAGAWSCGMVVGLINDIPSCQELIERLIAEAKDIIRGNLTALLAD